MKTVQNIVEDLCDGLDGGEPARVPLPNVEPTALVRLLELLRRRQVIEKEEFEKSAAAGAGNASATNLAEGVNKIASEWFQKEMSQTMNQDEMFQFILASNYLNCKLTLDAGCTYIANIIKGRTPEEIRKVFHINNDFTPEEEDEVRRENAWAFS
jgi:S-phase kinase-associated protein 1